MDSRKCSRCRKKEEAERFHLFELVWKCDLILNQTIQKGILCEACQMF